ncbi:integrin alpha FG-GAP repeat containing protein 1, partial [Phenoliferia sp. Uapishka_3]
MRLGLWCATTTFLAYSVTHATAWQLGVEQRFVEEKLVIAGSLGLPTTGLVAAFGDFNADQLLDVFFLSADQRSLSVYEWDREAYSFKERVETRIRTPSSFIIQNVVPGDYDYDGRLDVLLMGEDNPGGWWGTVNTLQMQVYLQKSDGSFSGPEPVDPSGLAQPMPFDATGDMRPDLLGFTLDDNKKSVTPKLWKNVWESSNHTAIFELSDPPLDLSTSACTFPSPHSNAYIDLDGDCLADIFLMCQGKSDEYLTYQIWTNTKEGSYKLARSGDLPKGTKSVGFADMDRDGTIDMVITSCSSDGKCNLSIAYNSQVPLCTPRSSGPCRDPEALCVADDNFAFDLDPSASNDDFTSIPISTLIPGASLITESTAFRGLLPTPPSIGDYNIDGYPDLLILTSRSGNRVATLLESKPCDRSSCTAGQMDKGRRAFKVRTDGAEVLTKITDAESVHWVDMDDDGSLDIMVQRSGGGGASRQVVFIKNNYFHDAFFLKALVLNGACPGWCEPKEAGETRYRPYGVSYSGASFKFTVLDPTGSRKATQVGQLPQSSYLALGTPYSYFGLGRTNNYVENLFIGSTRRQPEHFINVEGLIPNSQVVIDPYQPSGRFDTSSWSRELYLHPGDWIPWVTIVLGATICALGVVVLVLNFNEKREDEIERRARLLSLNFQAL